MFGIGSTELLVILVVALIVLGPKSLAKVSRSLGKAIAEFRRVSTDFQRTINLEMAEEETRQKEKDRKAKAASQQNISPENIASPKAAETAGKAAVPEDSPLAQALARSQAMAQESGTKSADMNPKS